MPGPLSERTDVLELIAAEAARARAGTGGLVLLRGATGTGRTAVLEAAVRDAEAHGMRVLLARCAPCDQAQYFASLTRLLHPAQPTGRPAAGEHEPFQDRDERVVSGHLLLRVAELSEDRPLLVAVDDAHLADPASRRWLVEAARHVDRMPVLLLVTERSQYDIAPPTPGLAHTLPPDLVRTHTLAPLSGRSTALLARGRVGDAAWPRVESRVRASAGHPLLLHALLEDLGGSGAEAVPESSAMLYPGPTRPPCPGGWSPPDRAPPRSPGRWPSWRTPGRTSPAARPHPPPRTARSAPARPPTPPPSGIWPRSSPG